MNFEVYMMWYMVYKIIMFLVVRKVIRYKIKQIQIKKMSLTIGEIENIASSFKRSDSRVKG